MKGSFFKILLEIGFLTILSCNSPKKSTPEKTEKANSASSALNSNQPGNNESTLMPTENSGSSSGTSSAGSPSAGSPAIGMDSSTPQSSSSNSSSSTTSSSSSSTSSSSTSYDDTSSGDQSSTPSASDCTSDSKCGSDKKCLRSDDQGDSQNYSCVIQCNDEVDCGQKCPDEKYHFASDLNNSDTYACDASK